MIGTRVVRYGGMEDHSSVTQQRLGLKYTINRNADKDTGPVDIRSAAAEIDGF